MARGGDCDQRPRTRRKGNPTLEQATKELKAVLKSERDSTDYCNNGPKTCETAELSGLSLVLETACLTPAQRSNRVSLT